ncbi:MAG: TIGR02300 family protein, partial [Alphaproteobacteria bacterium]
MKASWGTKRTCQSCAARFYDLNKGPIKCPKCGREHDREDFVKV